MHNRCSLFPRDKLRVCIFKAFDNHSTNRVSKGWANFHPNQKDGPYRGNHTALLLSFSICLSSKEIDYFSCLINWYFSFHDFPICVHSQHFRRCIYFNCREPQRLRTSTILFYMLQVIFFSFLKNSVCGFSLNMGLKLFHK